MRTKGRSPNLASAVILADTHLRDDQPVCRTDDYFRTQLDKLEWVIAKVLNNRSKVLKWAPLIIAGDVFDHWKPSPLLLAETIRILRIADHEHSVVVVAGQHDLPQHNLSLLNKTGLAVLEKGAGIRVLKGGDFQACVGFNVYGWSWGEDWETPQMDVLQTSIAVLHTPTWLGNNPYGSEVPSAIRLLKRMTGFDLVVVGDNHQTFTKKFHGGGTILSPGSMCRMEADQKDHVPVVWLWNNVEKTLGVLEIPHREDSVSRQHLDKKEERSKDLNAFVEQVGQGSKGKRLSFQKELEREVEKKETDEELRKIMYEALEKEYEEE
jgi:DNA repair exonuclease SbcCD nuclease subunit